MQERLFVEEPTLSVADLSAAVAGVVARAFPDEVWVRGEIADLNRAPSGHVYFTLAGDDACIAVTLFESDRQVVNGILRRAGGAVRMTDGTEVRIRARVSWFARRGTLQLRMVAIDPAYTLGRLAEDRERLVRVLAASGVLAKQSSLALAAVPLRVGLVTSEHSAAAADFLQTLAATGWAWQVTLVDTRVQGVEAVDSLVAALATLGAHVSLDGPLDVICVVRGGGARTELAVFDQERVVRAIAECPVPVLTGIGHEIDNAVADLAAHRSYKTPTACAAALVAAVAAFLDRCAQIERRVGRAAVLAVERADGRLERASGRAAGASRHHLRATELALEAAGRRLARDARRVTTDATRSLDANATRVSALDPARALARGWSVTHRADGTLVRVPGDVTAGDELVTTVTGGEVRSVAR